MRPPCRNDELTRSERRQVVRDEERVRRDLPATVGAFDDDGAAKRRKAQGDLGRSVRVRNAASDGATVPRHEVPDVGECFTEKRMHASVAFDRRLAHGRADHHVAVGFDSVKAGTVEIDEQRGPHESHVESRDKALTARDRFRILAAARERLERFGE